MKQYAIRLKHGPARKRHYPGMLKYAIMLICLLMPLSLLAHRFQDNTEYARGVFVDSLNHKMPYRLLSPTRIEKGEMYPLVIFLHGAGERGDDNISQLEHGSAIFSDTVNAEKYPSFVLFPQCKKKFWTEGVTQKTFMPGAKTPPISTTETTLMSLIHNIIANNPIDINRIYIIGLSMGGIATYDLVCRYPQLFAAAIPICGAVNPDRLPKARDVNFLIFHGEDDDEVPIICGREAYKALEEAGAKVEYVEFPGVGHECWDCAFDYPSLLPWLYSQHKERQPESLASTFPHE